MFWEKSQEIGEDRFVCIQQMKRAIVIWSSFYYELQIGQYIVLTGLTWAQIPIQSFSCIEFFKNIHYPHLPLPPWFSIFSAFATFIHLSHFCPLVPLYHELETWPVSHSVEMLFFFLLASFPPLKSLMLFLLVKNWEETLHTKKIRAWVWENDASSERVSLGE